MRTTVILLFLFLNACVEQPTAEQVREQIAAESTFAGTIVCWNPSDGSEVLRTRVDDWNFSIHSESPLNASIGQRGRVRITGNHVSFIDENGNRIYLVNHPCRLIYPPSE